MQKLTFYNYKIQNNADVCDIYIDGVIVDASTEQFIRDWWNDDTPTSFKKVRSQISESAKTVNVYVNSGGGQVVEAMAIHDYLKNLSKNGVTVNTFGRGLIASSATYILMASSNSTISENSWFMVHNVSGGIYGDVNEIENYAVMMRKFNDQITDFYSSHTGLSNTVIKNMMNKETWFTGAEAVEQGFVKNKEGNSPFTNCIKPENWLFNNKQVLQAYNSSIQTSKNMNIKQLVQDALNDLGFGKKPANEITSEMLATTIENALKPLTDQVDDKVKNAVAEATKNIGTEIKNAVTEAIKDIASKEDIKDMATKEDIKDLATTQSVKDEVKKVSDELEAVKGDIANKKGGEAGGGKGANNQMDKEGITWK